jgi:hypothetical protein
MENPQPQPGVALLDLNVLKPFIEIGREDYLDILNDVTRDIPSHLERIRDAIATGDTIERKSRLHSTRGMISYFGCVVLMTRLFQIEHQETIPTDQADTIHGELHTLWEKSLAALKDWEMTVPEFST